MAMDVKIGDPDGGELTPFFTGKAKFNPATDRGAMTLTRQVLAGIGDLADDGAGADAGAEQRMLFFGDVVQESAFPLPGGERWLRIDASDPRRRAEARKPRATWAGSAATGQSTSLTSAVLWLDGATEVGADEIRDGESATKYETVIDIQKATDASDEAAQVAEPFRALGVSTFPATVWIDDQGVMRQLAYTITVEEGGESGMPAGTRLDYFVDVWDFGVEVSVKEPPAGQVMDFDEALGNMQNNLEDVQGDIEDLASELGGSGG